MKFLPMRCDTSRSRPLGDSAKSAAMRVRRLNCDIDRRHTQFKLPCYMGVVQPIGAANCPKEAPS